MERTGYLDITDPRQLMALHFVYRPRVQQGLDLFIAAWNSHPVRTERSRTPEQIFFEGGLRNGVDGQSSDVIDEFYGVDGEEYPSTRDTESVEVDDVLPRFPIDFELLSSGLNPMKEDGNFGVEIFLQAKQLLGY